MKLRNKQVIEEYIKKHADSKTAFNKWIASVEDANWTQHNDINAEFPSADYVGKGRYVFNIKGNKYRTITIVAFIANLVSIQFVGTHAEYDKIKDCSTI
jgi:mRNA interferase HigB